MKNKNLRYKIFGMSFLVLILIPILFFSFTKKFNEEKGNFYIKNGLIYSPATNNIFSGEITDTVNNKIIQYNVVKGLKNGEFIIRYMNGNFQIKGLMKDNKNSGEWRYYYPSGQLESIGKFKNDVVSDQWIWFYENGKIKESGIFIKGKREGKWNVYDKDGKLKTILYFSNGKIITKLEARETLSS
jgi:antitoxin component YwqK of YwqJK toxin-antitoxin module